MRVLTMGTFDLLHPGHVALFRECRRLAGSAGTVIAAVNTDAFVAKFKRQPTMTGSERADMIGALRDVDVTIMNDGLDQAGLIEYVGPEILAVGIDWSTRDYYGQLGITPAWLDDRGISLVYLAHERSATVSTTAIRARLARQEPPADWLHQP